MSDPILDALNAAAQQGAASAPGQPGSAPSGSAPAPQADAVLSALQQRAAQPDPAPVVPPSSRGFIDQVGDFWDAATHHLSMFPAGLAQTAAHSQSGMFDSFGPLVPQFMKDGMHGMTSYLDQQIAQREAAYQKATPNSPGAYAGAAVGSAAPFFMGGYGAKLQEAGNAVAARVAPVLPTAAQKLGAKLVSGATQGAIAGGAQPVAQGADDSAPSLSDLVAPEPPQQGSFWEQKANQVGLGAAFGAAVPAVTVPIGAAWNAGKTAVTNSPILNPSGYAARQLAIQLGARAPAVANDLANAPTYVPGSVPTSAQAGADPRLVMMEKALANNSPEFKAALAARENANNAARLQAVGQVAQTPAALQAAIDQRAAVTGPMRDFAVTNGNPVPVEGVQGALSSLANGSLGVRPTIGGAATGMRSAVDDMTTVTPPNTLTNTPGSATAPPAMLDALRQNANDYLSKYAPQGFVGTQEQAAMTPVKGAIIDAIEAANPGHKLSAGGWGQGLPQMGPEAPGYRDYLAEFAKRSVPVNTMQVGQQLQDTLNAKALNSGGNPMATLTNYQSALAKALRGSDYGIDAAAQAQLEDVGSDLQRATISNSIRAPGGSDTVYNAGAGTTFLRAMGADSGNDFGKMATAGGATLAATGSPQAAAAAAFGAKKAGTFVTNRVSGALGDLLLDPQKLAQALMQNSNQLSTQAPSAFGQLTGSVGPAARAALVAELLKAQAPQVVAPNQQKAEAHQP